jgi:hypothetical protein
MFSMTTLSAKIEAQLAVQKACFHARRPIMRKSIYKQGFDCAGTVKLSDRLGRIDAITTPPSPCAEPGTWFGASQRL